MVEPVPIPYEELSDLAYNADAAKTSKVTYVPDESRPDAIIIEGPCPRCAHPTVFTEHVVVYLDAGADPASDGSFDDALDELVREYRKRRVVVLCACRGRHADQPHDKKGCGASWALNLEWDGR